MAKAKQDSSIVKWDEEMAKAADVAAGMTADLGGGKFISTRGGVLSIDGAPVPGNKLGAIVLAFVRENAMYEGEFDADNPTSPTCFAFGQDPATMTPHKVAVDAGTAQKGPCSSCPMNVFGSADKGRGKACKNIVRMALIAAGQFNGEKFKLIDDEDYYRKGDVRFLKTSVTSTAGFGAYVKQIKDAAKTHPMAFVTKISLVPDPKSQYKLTFEPLQQIPKSIGAAIVARHKEQTPLLEQPYQPNEEGAQKKGKGAKGKPAKARY